MSNALQKLIDAQRAASIRPGYSVPDTKPLGILVARHLKDGDAVLETAIAALHDLNFHAEADQVAEILRQVVAS